MKLLRLLISLLSIATCAFADDAAKQDGDGGHHDALLELFESLLSVYVRSESLGNKDVLEFGVTLE